MSGKGDIPTMSGPIDDLKHAVEQRLHTLVGANVRGVGGTAQGRLSEAMAYSLLAPAKRVRALGALLAAEHCGGNAKRAIDAAASIEMVHAASLVLDDLPAMDDAQVRRGRPTCHLAFGEDMALLAAIALMNLGFATAAGDQGLGAPERNRLTLVLARAIGTDGLTGGQARDLDRGRAEAAPSSADSLAEVERTHGMKTGALFAAAAEAGAIVAGGQPATEALMGRFGLSLGIAFQAYDDILDAHATAAAIGKDVARDRGKSTMVDVLGRGGAEARARALVAEAMVALAEARVGPGPSRLEGYVAGLLDQLTRPLAATR